MRLAIALMVLALTAGPAHAQSGNGLKVFISVDMEGITGVVNWEDVSRTGKDYDYFRRIMTEETNAAIEGALAAGATEIIVRDSHGSARNILPGLLNRNARLIRDWSRGPKGMMEGIDESFDAALLIGYHASTANVRGVRAHTMSSANLTSIKVNGVEMPEAGISALIAGHFGVPVVMISGDDAIADEATALIGDM
jgi:D-amino peptidase